MESFYEKVSESPGQKLATVCVSVPSTGLAVTQHQLSACFDLYMPWLFLATLKIRAVLNRVNIPKLCLLQRSFKGPVHIAATTEIGCIW